jgi:hypothetical protein
MSLFFYFFKGDDSMAIDTFRDPLYIKWYTDSQGNKISVERLNEQYQIVKNKITLAEIPDEFDKVQIDNFYEVKSGKTLDINEFSVNYTLGEITFHESHEAETITIKKYKSRGIIYYPASRVYSEYDPETHEIKETLQNVVNNMTHRGEYSNIVQYYPRNIVYYAGGSYMCIKRCINIPPSNTSYWQQLTLPGLDLVFRGEYDHGLSYDAKDAVSYGGSIYYCLTSSTGHLPTDTNYWSIFMPKSIAGILKNTVTFNTPKSNVQIGISGFNYQNDELMVFVNSTYVEKDKDYTMNIDGLSIDKIDGSWSEDGSTTTINFLAIKNVLTTINFNDGSLLQDGSVPKTKLTLDVQNKLDEIGNLSTSTTTDKSSVINITNEINGKVDEHLADYAIYKGENANEVISSLLKRLQAGEITKIKLIGDSITEGYGATGHVQLVENTNNGNPVIFDNGVGTKWYEALYTDSSWANLFRNYISANFSGVTFTNAGIGGKTAKWALLNAQYWIDNDEDVVFVMLGANDKYHTTTLAEYKSDITQLLAYIKARCNLMIVMTENPATDDYDESGAKGSWNYFTTADIDRVLTEVCNENGYSHISLYREFLNHCKATSKSINEYVESIGPHTTNAGHELIWDILQKQLGLPDNYVNLKNKQTVSIPQILIDGNFQVAQAVPTVGTEVTNPTSYTYPVFDMWKVEYYVGGGDALPTTIKHSQRKITDSGAAIDAVPGSKYCYRVNVNGAGTTANSQYNIAQSIENGVSKYCVGVKNLPVSFWARSSISGKKIQASAYLNYGTGGSPSAVDYTSGSEFTLSSTWRKYTLSIPIPSLAGKTFGTDNNDYLNIRFSLAGAFQNFVGVGDIEIAQVQVSVGGASEFPLKSFDEELRDCQRYFEKSYNYSTSPKTQTADGIVTRLVVNNSIGNYQSYGAVGFMRTKRTAPTVTIYPYVTPINANRVSNGDASADLGADSGVAYNIGHTGFSVRNQNGESLTTNNNLVQFHWVADCRI